MILLVNGIKYDNFQNKIKINSGETLIKIKFQNNNFYISCDEMFKDIKEIKSVHFQNFKFCNSSNKMFSGCSSLETLNLISFNTDNIENMYRMFSGCSKLKTLGVSSFNTEQCKNTDNMFCDCKKLKINKSQFNDSSFTCIEQCKGDLPYLIKEKNICVKDCILTNSKFLIEENKICLRECKNSEYKYTIIHNKTCVKECPKNLFKFNLECLLECPYNSHKNEFKNLCECNYKFFVNEQNITTCLNINVSCINTEYPFLIKDKNQCLKNCSLLDFPFKFNYNCYNKCPKNSYSKNNNNICICLYKYYRKNNELICLNENEDCNEEYSFYNINRKECVKMIHIFLIKNVCQIVQIIKKYLKIHVFVNINILKIILLYIV